MCFWMPNVSNYLNRVKKTFSQHPDFDLKPKKREGDNTVMKTNKKNKEKKNTNWSSPFPRLSFFMIYMFS